MPPPDTRPPLAAHRQDEGQAPARRGPHLRARDWARRRPTTHLLLKAVVLGVGLVLIAAGAVMLVVPGPGVAAVVLGLVVLASEYAWAHRLLDPLRRLAAQGLSLLKLRNGSNPERPA